MKSYIAILAATATALSPIAATNASAAATFLTSVTPDARNGDTDGAMQTQCNALAATLPSEGVDETAVTVTNVVGPTYVSGPSNLTNRQIDLSTVVGRGTFTLGGTYWIDGDPFRNGGSVNMFGLRYASKKFWTNSEYDFTGDYDSVYSYSFGCHVVQTTHHPDVPNYQDYPLGHYVNPSDDAFTSSNGNHGANGDNNPNGGGAGSNGNGGANNGNGGTNGNHGNNESCNGFDPKDAWWGTDKGACQFIAEGGTGQILTGYTPVPDTVVVTDFGSDATTAVLQPQSDNLRSHETFGPEPAEETGRFDAGKPVICISPKKLPGTWTTQNGYTGAKCTTAWYYDPTIVWNAAHAESHNYVTIPGV